MKLFLAMDTATDYGSVAVGKPGAVAAELVFAKRRHASDLMPAIVEVLRIAGGDLIDIVGIIVANGPGSFTGLRIGFSTAKGILRECRAASLHTAPSLLCSAYGARLLSDGPVVAMYDALRGDVFGAVYSFEHGSVCCHVPPTLGKISDIRQKCEVDPIVAVGDGAMLHPHEVLAWTGRDPVGPPDFVPRAAFLLDLLAVDVATRRIDKPKAFEPEYGRLAEAQVKLEKAVGDSGGTKTGR
ncbi:tRNA (adenosine(37)-N6)-threonylcarbamoyltransferase complex dimerization subunit type 1 TsaB [Gemmatimonadota bacterium]